MSKDAVEVRGLRRSELTTALAVIARGMRDNPLHVAAYGEDPRRRLRCHARLVGAKFAVSPGLQLLGAFRAGTLVAVTGVAPVGTCQPTAAQRLWMLPRLLPLGPRTVGSVSSWVSTWGRHDPAEPHVHLGPLAVDAYLQGKGIGSAVMREHCQRLDATREVGYLETDKAANVRFYERFGYYVVAEEAVIGVPNWFMRRPAAERTG